MSEQAPMVLADGSAWLPLVARDGTVRCWARIDAADIEAVSGRRWRLSTKGYAIAGTPSKGTDEWLHRVIMGVPKGDPREVDHIDRNKLDCRRANLRIGTGAQNRQNTPSRAGTSAFRGVALRADTLRFDAYCNAGGKRHRGGSYDSEAMAAAKAALMRSRLHFPSPTDGFFVLDLRRLPVSLNQIGTRGSRWAVTRAKRELQDELGALLMVAAVPRGMAHARADVFFTFPDRRRRDPGNLTWILEKALGDALVERGVIPDDTAEYFRFGELEINPERGRPRTEIVLRLRGV